jgi:hypothetical protein
MNFKFDEGKTSEDKQSNLSLMNHIKTRVVGGDKTRFKFREL